MSTRLDARFFDSVGREPLRHALATACRVEIDRVIAGSDDPVTGVNPAVRYYVERRNGGQIPFAVTARVDDSLAPDEARFAAVLARELRASVITHLPDYCWTDGYWLLAQPNDMSGEIELWMVPDSYASTEPHEQDGGVDMQRQHWKEFRPAPPSRAPKRD